MYYVGHHRANEVHTYIQYSKSRSICCIVHCTVLKIFNLCLLQGPHNPDILNSKSKNMNKNLCECELYN